MHINYFNNKFTQCVAMLKVCNYANQFAASILFRSYFSYIMYDCECWCTACKMRIDCVAGFAKSTLRLIFNLFPRLHCASYTLLKFVFNLFHDNSLSTAVCNLFSRSLHSHFTCAVSNNMFTLHFCLRLSLQICVIMYSFVEQSAISLESLIFFKPNVMQSMFNSYT